MIEVSNVHYYTGVMTSSIQELWDVFQPDQWSGSNLLDFMIHYFFVMRSVRLFSHFQLLSLLFSGVDSFSGIFGDLPKRCFLSNEDIMFSNPLVDTNYPVVVSLQSGNVSVLKDYPHVGILDVAQGFIVGAKRCVLQNWSKMLYRQDHDDFCGLFCQLSWQ